MVCCIHSLHSVSLLCKANYWTLSVYFFIRETRGRTLENMNELFIDKEALDEGSSTDDNAVSEKAVESKQG